MEHMEYIDDDADFDLDRFIRAMGFEPWRESEEFCWWRQEEKMQFLRREGDDLVIEGQVEVDYTQQGLIGPAPEWIEEGPHGIGTRFPVMRWRMPWPTTFNEAFSVFNSIGWFGQMPMRRQLMETYEALATKR